MLAGWVESITLIFFSTLNISGILCLPEPAGLATPPFGGNSSSPDPGRAKPKGAARPSLLLLRSFPPQIPPFFNFPGLPPRLAPQPRCPTPSHRLLLRARPRPRYLPPAPPSAAGLRLRFVGGGRQMAAAAFSSSFTGSLRPCLAPLRRWRALSCPAPRSASGSLRSAARYGVPPPSTPPPRGGGSTKWPPLRCGAVTQNGPPRLLPGGPRGDLGGRALAARPSFPLLAEIGLFRIILLPGPPVVSRLFYAELACTDFLASVRLYNDINGCWRISL